MKYDNGIDTPNSKEYPFYPEDASESFKTLYEVIRTLRAPGGCPWDREQDPLKMRSDLAEETFECIDAISSNDAQHAREELGDVFLNATMISYMYEQSGDFTVADVLSEVAQKIVRRHPHVWKDSEGAVNANEKKAETSEEVLAQWDNIKRGVEGRSEKSVIDEVVHGLPPLMRAYKIQKKAAKKGFDWESAELVWQKVYEELDELKLAVKETEKSSSENQEQAKLHAEEELGDVLFSVVNLARKLNIDPTLALARSNKKFRDRFAYVEQKMSECGIPMDAEHMKQMDSFWDEAKKS
jgi:tetrapyrrole methylase family protein/MazG family protein